MAVRELQLPNFDPSKAIYEESRSLCGPLNTGTVTLNQLFGGSPGAPLYGRWLWVGVSGDVNYVKWDGTAQVLPNAVAGVWHPILAIQINSALTTASGFVWGN